MKAGDMVIYDGAESLSDGDPVVPTERGTNTMMSLAPATGEAPGNIQSMPGMGGMEPTQPTSSGAPTAGAGQ
ncbi:MAG TPA: hypothetical protein VGS41_03390 [Chthonomonadales bacterium]|nr:hypothetical protein [Chthonomonadales bacterium]